MNELWGGLARTDFMPHGYCLKWTPGLVGLHVLSDAVIALAYFSIPLSLLWFVRARKDLAFSWVFVMFGAFILLCGATHVLAIWTLWYANYYAEGVVKAATAAVSIGTAVALLPIIPRALMLRSPAELEIEVAKRTTELARAHRDLETIFFVASHDLREPIRTIQGFSQMVSTRYTGKLDEKGDDYLMRIHRASNRMATLLDSLLELSRAQRLEVPSEAVSSAEIVREVLERLGDKARATNARISVADGLPLLHVNPTWAAAAVYNLLSNALKHCVPGEAPSVEIEAFVPLPGEPAGTGLVVKDRGPGVRREMRERIFDLFFRGVGREIEGTGTGLAIVRQVAERHGGAAWVRAREGGGSEFVVTFGEA
jgi:signal transduction histidine kinase